MAPPSRSAKTRRAKAEDAPHISNVYMAFSMSLDIAYQQAKFASKSRGMRPHVYQKRPAAAAAIAPRAPPPAKTVARCTSRARPLPDLPTAVICDPTHKRLSVEAQFIQDQARNSHKFRLSNLSDCESLRCLESFPLNVTTRPALVDRPTTRKPRTPPILRKCFPPSPPKLRSPCFDRDAPQTTRPTNSSGEPLKSILADGNSFLDDFELSQDDDFFRDDGKEVGDLLPAGGTLLFAQLGEIRTREAGRSRGSSSASSSLPRVLSDGTTDRDMEEEVKVLVPARDLSDGEVWEEWQHVERSAVLRREMEEEKQEQAVDTVAARRKDSAHVVGADLVVMEVGPSEHDMIESGNVEWHVDTAALADAMCESKSVGHDTIDDLTTDDENEDAVDDGFADPVVVGGNQAANERENTDDEPLEEESDWVQVDGSEDELNEAEF